MITINDLSFAYSSEKVLDSISTTFEQGRVYGLLGANGVGKSTLFKLLCGLLTAKEGNIEIDGYSPADRKPGFLSRMFYIPEDFEGPSVSIKNYADGISDFYPNYDEQLLHSLLSDFEIDINRKFTTLSLGQRKRAILCIALAMNTEYLLLDEPTNGLDIPSKLEFRKMVARTMDDKVDTLADNILGYIGMYAAYLNGLDALVFTGGIGLGSDLLRKKVCSGLGYLGLTLDDAKNQGRGDGCISTDDSRVTVWRLKTDEESVVAACVREYLGDPNS